ncbi:MAG TPA: hypothetical protein VE621_12865 [Bryobacteraceae bacterium]|nr:hypothetical protein [Bryobacteraceae bacterium]
MALVREYGFVIDLVRREVSFAILAAQQSVLDQPIRADEKLITSEGRQGLIRRVAVASGTERQGLPPALSGMPEPIDPRQSSRSDVADPVSRGSEVTCMSRPEAR